MEKMNIAIADDNERMLELLDEIISQDQELQQVGTEAPLALAASISFSLLFPEAKASCLHLLHPKALTLSFPPHP